MRVVIPLADGAKLDSGPAAVSYQFLDDPEPTQETWTVKDDDIWVFVPALSDCELDASLSTMTSICGPRDDLDRPARIGTGVQQPVPADRLKRCS